MREREREGEKKREYGSVFLGGLSQWTATLLINMQDEREIVILVCKVY